MAWTKEGDRIMTPEVKGTFLHHLRETASAKAAAEATGVSYTTAKRARHEDLDFALAWDDAVSDAYDQMLPEAYRRAMLGPEQPVVQGGRVVGTIDKVTGEEKPLTVRVPSDRLMEVMLKWRMPQAFATRVDVRVTEPLGLQPEVLVRMEPEERRALLVLLKTYAQLAAEPELSAARRKAALTATYAGVPR
jgi:hypothetical protein